MNLKIYAAIIPSVVIGIWILYAVSDGRVQRGRPTDAIFTRSASLYVTKPDDAAHDDTPSPHLGLLSRLGGSAATGQLDLLPERLRWRPGRVSRRQGFSQIDVARDDIVRARVWGDRLDAVLDLETGSGRRLRFHTRGARQLKASMTNIGIHVTGQKP